MRFGALSALVVLGASIVTASPIRVVVTEVSSTGNIRYGHAAADNIVRIPDHAPTFVALSSSAPVPSHRMMMSGGNGEAGKHRTGCGGMRGKALQASNALRQWLGLEPIKLDVIKLDVEHDGPHMHHAHHMGAQPVDVKFVEVKHGKDNPLPVLPYVGTPVRPAFGAESMMQEAHAHGHHGHWMGMRQHGPSFMRRLHHALMSLGPWEGRAVAFVLGCGIGVLLRMVWVMALVTARAFRSRREDETDYDVVFDEAEAEILVAPPQYTVLDGPVAVPVTEKSDKN